MDIIIRTNFKIFVFIWVFSNNFVNGISTNYNVRCMENGRFYRDPDRDPNKMWTSLECSKYYLCLEGEVFDFRCSSGLLFDINRQICDNNANVDNCDLTTTLSTIDTSKTRAPTAYDELEDEYKCNNNELECTSDGSCIPQEYFCDGSIDCSDSSDEEYCDLHLDPNGATPCNSSVCKLPKCFCSKDGIQIPDNLINELVPQMILLTFDDAINNDNIDLYRRYIFNGHRTNPNGCPIKSTFFVSHQNNNYYQTQKLWNDGHEIAIHSITHRRPKNWWAYNATIEDWFDEMIGQANILNRFSSIRMHDIRGLRAPFLKVGWNRQFLMMKEFGFAYDSSIIAPFSDPPLWPYTLDYKMPHECQNQNCPSRSYPGLWEIAINQLESSKRNCETVEDCPQLSGDEIYNMFMHNFKRHYTTNRAPFGLFFHSSWFKNPDYLVAFQKFIDDILIQPDVWFVTNWQAIKWMQSPTTINNLNNFKPWMCEEKFKNNEIACNSPNVCKVYSPLFQDDRYIHTCNECPKIYPWIRNEFGID